ncbi:MAG: RluA family pseudouridine synthase, partial [Armatimonadetes bacterium]|nr:RluA family pseudouridine synthase [Armatimonadota bacterium]
MSGSPKVQRGRRLTFFVPDDLDGERLDRALARLLPALSRSYLKKLAKDGLCWINGQQAAPDRHVARGDQVVLLLDHPVVPPCHAEPVPVRVVHEDAHTLVVFKPAGMVTHPAKGHAGGTLLNAVVGHLDDEIARGWARPHILTRLDKDTSGVVLIAKTPQAQRALQKALETRR